MNKVKIVQTSRASWRIETEEGFVLQKGITIVTPMEAHEYCKRYVSSFLCWSFEVVPLTKDEVYNTKKGDNL